MPKGRASESETKRKFSLKSNGKKLDIAALAFIDNMVFSKDTVTAYYRLNTETYDYLSDEAKRSNAHSTTLFFSSLMAERSEPLDIHYFSDISPLDVDSWVIQMHEKSKGWREHQTSAFSQYVRETSRHLSRRSFVNKTVYIGIQIGTRGELDLSQMNPFEAGTAAAFKTFKQWGSSLFSQFGSDVSPAEERSFRAREEEVFRRMRGTKFAPQRVTAEELLLYMKKMFYPAMMPPYLNVSHGERFSAGDLVYELGSSVESYYRWLEFHQLQSERPDTELVEKKGYRATLTLSSFAPEWDFPNLPPFFHYPETQTGVPLSSFCRFTLLPRDKMKKQVDRKKKEMDDEIRNAAKGSESLASSNEDLSTAVSTIQEMDAEISSSKSPWVKGSYHIVVEAEDVEGLKNMIQSIKKSLAEEDIVVLHTAGDQVDLFLEAMPGDKRRVKSFDQTTNLAMIAASGMNISSGGGDSVATPMTITYKDRVELANESRRNSYG